MKAPKKLYLRKRNKLPLEVVRGGEWCETDPKCMYGSVEYTRTDAFVDKAAKWIEEINNHHHIMRYSDSCEPSLSELTEWFRNYMEGE